MDVLQDGTKQFLERFPKLGAQWVHTVKYPEFPKHKPQDHVLCTETRWEADNDDFATLLQQCEELKKKMEEQEAEQPHMSRQRDRRAPDRLGQHAGPSQLQKRPRMPEKPPQQQQTRQQQPPQRQQPSQQPSPASDNDSYPGDHLSRQERNRRVAFLGNRYTNYNSVSRPHKPDPFRVEVKDLTMGRAAEGLKVHVAACAA